MDSMMFDMTRANYVIVRQRQKEGDRRKVLTIPRGNWRSMNKVIAGKIISDVRGFVETKAAVASELKATSNGMPNHSAMLQACDKKKYERLARE